MEQIKIFTRGFSDVADELEAEVNDWLVANKHYTITGRHTVVTSPSDGVVNCTIVVWFSTKKS